MNDNQDDQSFADFVKDIENYKNVAIENSTSEETYISIIAQLEQGIDVLENLKALHEHIKHHKPSNFIIQNYNLIDNLINIASESDDIYQVVCMILTFLTSLDYENIDTNTLIDFIFYHLEPNSPYINYSLYCFYNLEMSPYTSEPIHQNVDFSRFFSLTSLDENTDETTISLILQILQGHINQDSDVSFVQAVLELAVQYLYTNRSYLQETALPLIHLIIYLFPDTMTTIYDQKLRETLLLNLYDLNPVILRTSVDILAHLYKIGFRFEATKEEVGNFLSLFYHSNIGIVNSVMSFTLKMLVDSDFIMDMLFVYKCFDEFQEIIEHGSFDHRMYITMFMAEILINTGDKYFRRLIKEKRFIFVFSMLSFENPAVTNYIIPVLDRVFNEFSLSGKLDEIMEIFYENDGQEFVEEYFETFSNDEAKIEEMNSFLLRYSINISE
ncbi:hypothetical protein TVAG_363240 [Trichomonas vaginalis G3]|uniref:Uncharacterized protein n=1 Tax=Trichomonas vaginalis (strain ATCC PRA-98 / G3) TaxID=412133 RepID=A2FQI5_TRIV3|nr:armadillo (ARM) repeat-containing protein family [Trichomonas vaginalis G3]EAX92846.1 hypothetical protein TVAG_363240 [Trichomonas vaginalis G3]KAI5499408.1 armadillo (ARM) repeat-containing protein family [Trichomonas vaginalis G3]|eukprot:XP_001305776.1 hypothetical protein [Trichomonas vaginalis G3]